MFPKIPILLISGPVGVGKSTVGRQVAEILEAKRIPHTFVDFDQIRYTYPRPANDPWGNQLGLENLRAIWRNCSRSGSLNLILSYVVEESLFIKSLLKVIPEGDVFTVQLTASLESLNSRLTAREEGSALEWHLNRSVELKSILARSTTPRDHLIDTDSRAAIDIADEIFNVVKWRLQ